jgi:transcriptional regulator with XRE-family HTH domain
MNERSSLRTTLGFSQASAAAKAGVSLTTYRRWEADTASVSAKTLRSCETALAGGPIPLAAELQRSAAAFTTSWADDPRLTPRQAYAIAVTLETWSDGALHEWLRDPSAEPLHDVEPFSYFDRRIMFHVDENRAWADDTRERCRLLAAELEHGTLPFDRDGIYMDEVLIGATLAAAETYLTDMPELFDALPERLAVERDGDYCPGDDDCELVSDAYDDASRWDEWEVPVLAGHDLLPAILAARHPFTWFDKTPPTGPGYLHQLRTGSSAYQGHGGRDASQSRG